MSQNQEIIESKLCAYIDGELDSEGRAEIEKHLEANPQHRRLLESLRATRDLIRWLPREPAPPEVAETLSGQLERSVLLNYEGDSLRTSPWPRIFAVAAIVMLTAGLGVAVYYALPRSQRAPQLAFHSGTTETNTGDVVPAPLADGRNDSTAPSDLPSGGNDVEKMKFAAADDLKKGGALGAAKMSDESKQLGSVATNNDNNAVSSELDQLAEQVGHDPAAYLASAENANTYGNNFANNSASNFANNSTNNSANNSIAQNISPAPPAVLLLVRSDQPEQTGKQLTSYLTQQQIQWRQPPAPQQTDMLLRQQAQQKDKVAVSAKPGGPETMQQGRDFSVDRSETRYSFAKNGSGYAGGGGVSREAAAPPAAAPATTQRSEGASQMPSQGARQRAGQLGSQPEAGTLADATQNGTLQKQGANENEEALAVDSNRVYVCQMSRRQAEQLSNSIGNDSLQGAQVQNVYGLSFNNTVARNTTLNSNIADQTPASAGIENGARGAGEREHMGRGGLDANPAPIVPTPAGASIQQKAEIGPTTQPDGAPTFSLNSPAPPDRALSEGPSTRPAPIARAMTQQTAASQPGLRVLAATTEPADAPVNVVIMVQPTAASTAAAVPSTQPVSEPLPQKAQSAPSQQLPAVK